MQLKTLRTLAAAVVVAAATLASAQSAAILKPADMQKLLPASVYYKGQSAPTQIRNSGGIKFADGHYLLATLVDTSGYSSDVAARYQGYVIAEVPLKFAGQSLPAGVYGEGFVSGKFILTDIGGHDVLNVPSVNDTTIKRPTPLQVIADPSGGFRLYSGREYVNFTR